MKLANPNKRSTEEWIGATLDSRPPPKVRLRIFERWGGVCYLSGRRIRGGEAWELEHVIAIANGGENREANLRPALVAPHRVKTADDRGEQTKTERTRQKFLGIFPQSPHRIQSRGFKRRGAI